MTGEQMKAFDREAIEGYGLPSLILMEHAGRRVAEAVCDRWNAQNLHVLALSGKGNNGGDALCAARHLLGKGAAVEALIVGAQEASGLSDETRTQAQILDSSGISLRYVPDEEQLPAVDDALARNDVLIDGLLGIGVKGAVRGIYKPVIERVNASDLIVVAVDLPSGIDSDTGRAEGAAVAADLTVTLEYPKLGLLLYPGRSLAGELAVRAIGYPRKLRATFESPLEWVDEAFVRARLPRRGEPSHKGDYGRALVVAGSRGLSGAALMAGEAALRSGTGLVYMGYPKSLNTIMESGLLEAVKFPLPESDREGSLSEMAGETITELLKEQRVSVMALGPGISRQPSVVRLIRSLLPEIRVPIVIDADGLNNLADEPGRDLLRELAVPAILTPHPGELSRLTGREIAEIERDRVAVAQESAQDLNVILVLKGVPTVTALPSGKTFVNSTGNSGLATGGSGDVLTGLITGLVAQGMTPEESAPAGVYLHGLLADRLRLTMGERAMLPRDLLDVMPEVLREFEPQ